MRRHRPRGLTMAIALVLLLLVSAALIAVTQLVSDDARHTLDERRGAQLRALLLAGRDHAVAELNATQHVQDGAVAIPTTIGDAGLSIESKVDAQRCILTVRAELDSKKLNGQFDLVSSNGRWSASAAELDVP